MQSITKTFLRKLTALFILLTFPCSSKADPLSIATNEFAYKTYEQLHSIPGNFFFSPYSIASALQMTLPGAKGNTYKQILSALAIKDDKDLLHNALSLNNQLKTTDNITFSIANSLWGEQSYGLQDSYIETVQKYFLSEVHRVDFKNYPEKQRFIINEWVSGKTNKRIKDLLAPGMVNSSTRAILTNAVYFLADWTTEFDTKNTHPGTFFISNDIAMTAQFMARTGSYQYYENETLQVVQLPYKGNNFAMEILLPRKNIDTIEKLLQTPQSTTWIDKLQSKKVAVQIPRFKSESSFSLVDTLSKLGIEDAFRFGIADFSGISNNKELFISDVVHKAFVEVAEKGTEAAAATAIIMEAGSAYRPQVEERPIIFRAERPFIFQIRHLPSRTILFLGRVENPVHP